MDLWIYGSIHPYPINKAKVDFYLMKPSNPPQENLYPALDDLLDDSMASFRPSFEGIRVVVSDGRQSHMKQFLSRNGIPYPCADA